MRYRFTLAALACSMGLIATALPAEARINQRQHKQQGRIDRGIASGNLTARETNRLHKQQGRIASFESRSRADGPGLTRAERLRLETMQGRASANIYRQKHDRQRTD